MTVYLMRHGQAGAAPSDAARELTEDGIRAVGRVCERARRAGAAPALIATSTYTRAIQTAEIAARVLGYEGYIERTTALLPDASPFDAWDAVRAMEPAGDILIAAHEPLTSALTAALLDAPTLRMKVPAGAIVAIGIERLAAQPNGVLLWMVTPALAG